MSTLLRNLTNHLPSVRASFFLLSATCAAAIGAALVMQYALEMEPCPLCISQRVIVILVGIVALLGGIAARKTIATYIVAALGLIVACIGSGVSARHVWLQSLPADEVPLCGPGLSYMFETRPLFDALSLLFEGDGHCAEVNWSLLGLSIPGWTLVFFVACAATFIWLAVRTYMSNTRPK